MVVLAGHTRLEAARQLGLETAPVHVAKGLTDAQARAFRIMDNSTASPKSGRGSDDGAEDFDEVDGIIRSWWSGLRHDSDLTVLQWADHHRRLGTRATAEPGRYRSERTPYMRAIMDALSPGDPTQRVVFVHEGCSATACVLLARPRIVAVSAHAVTLRPDRTHNRQTAEPMNANEIGPEARGDATAIFKACSTRRRVCDR